MSFFLLGAWLLFGWMLPEEAWFPALLGIAIVMFLEGCKWTQATGVGGGLFCVCGLALATFAGFSMGGEAQETVKTIVEAPSTYDWSTGTMIGIGLAVGVVIMLIGKVLNR